MRARVVARGSLGCAPTHRTQGVAAGPSGDRARQMRSNAIARLPGGHRPAIVPQQPIRHNVRFGHLRSVITLNTHKG